MSIDREPDPVGVDRDPGADRNGGDVSSSSAAFVPGQPLNPFPENEGT
jgi:hypothetical protein